MVDAQTVAQAVFNEQLLAVLDALGLLHRVDRAGHVAAADGGVAADDAHLFEHQHAQTGAAGLKGAGHTGKTGADDDDVEFFVIVLDEGSGDTGVGGGSGHDGARSRNSGLEKTAAGHVNVLHFANSLFWVDPRGCGPMFGRAVPGTVELVETLLGGLHHPQCAFSASWFDRTTSRGMHSAGCGAFLRKTSEFPPKRTTGTPVSDFLYKKRDIGRPAHCLFP